MTYTFKLTNPYRADQEIKQEVVVTTEDLVYDYENVTWAAMDTEYLSFNHLQDRLCVIQVCTAKPEEPGSQRVELLYVYESDISKHPKLAALWTNPNVEKLFHVFSADVPRISNFVGEDMQGGIFDTKVAAKIAWTNTRDHGMKNLIQMFVDPNFDQQNNTKGLNDWEVGPENWTEDQIFYMMQDVVYLDVLKNRIMDMAKRRRWDTLVTETMQTLPTLAKLYKHGFTEGVIGY